MSKKVIYGILIAGGIAAAIGYLGKCAIEYNSERFNYDRGEPQIEKILKQTDLGKYENRKSEWIQGGK